MCLIPSSIPDPGIIRVLMEADYDVYFADALNRGNDVLSQNMSSRLEEQDRGSAADGIEAAVSIVVPIIFSFIVIIGLFGTFSSRRRIRLMRPLVPGNALVVMVVICNPQMRSTTNLLIINLAVADLLFIGSSLPSADPWSDLVIIFLLQSFASLSLPGTTLSPTGSSVISGAA